MKKSSYVLICLLLSIKFWHFSFLQFLTNDFNLALTWLWGLCAFVFFHREPKRKSLYGFKYLKYTYFIFLGVFISMFSAYFFWEQEFIITFIAQRYIYAFILLPSILYVQPTEKDIVFALKWITIGTIIAWCISIISPGLIASIGEAAIDRRLVKDTSDIGFNVAGTKYVVFYLYFKIEEYIKQFSWRSFLWASLLIVFIVLYQNRSLILGIIPVFAYSFLRFRSKYKIGLAVILSFILVGGLLYSWDIWASLLEETQSQLNNPDYNRLKALAYYFNDYSPNWFCYIFGNGFPSAHNSFGLLMWYNFTRGIYASDLGMIGMWTTYGVIPLIAIYSVLINILRSRSFPLYLKFMSFHVLFVPTIFHFWSNPGILLFVLLIYLFAYHTEQLTQNEIITE